MKVVPASSTIGTIGRVFASMPNELPLLSYNTGTKELVDRDVRMKNNATFGSEDQNKSKDTFFTI